MRANFEFSTTLLFSCTVPVASVSPRPRYRRYFASTVAGYDDATREIFEESWREQVVELPDDADDLDVDWISDEDNLVIYAATGVQN
jgi:hypothetical protein